MTFITRVFWTLDWDCTNLGRYPSLEKVKEKEKTVFYKIRMVALAMFEKTNKELYDFLHTNLIEAVTTGKPSGADVVLELSTWVPEDFNSSA